MSVPSLIGGYLVGEELGAGATSTVHAAVKVSDGGFRRAAAIKRLHDALRGDAEVLAMLVDEARLAGRIAHRNVVPAYDAFTWGSQLYVVMDLVRGVSLHEVQRLRGGEPVPVAVAVAVAHDVLSGLHASHALTDAKGASLGVVHRDVTPQNILVGADGEARLTDFGIAKAVGRHQATRTGLIKGKLAYMAPEAFEGVATPQGDVYALAVCLWEMLTGRHPFASDADDDAALVDAIRRRAVPRPSRWADDVPPALDAVVLRGLERDRDLRFASARAMAEALAEASARASSAEVAAWLTSFAASEIERKDRIVSDLEQAALHAPSPADAAPPVDARARARARRRAGASRRTGPVAAAALLTAAASLVTWSAVRDRGHASVPDAPAPSVAATSPSPPSPLAPSPPVPPTSATAAASTPADVTPPTAPPRSRARATPSDCAHPTWLDARGVKHYDVKCTR